MQATSYFAEFTAVPYGDPITAGQGYIRWIFLQNYGDPFRTNASSAGASVKYRISSARAGSGKPRSCASSSSENTSLVATSVPSPEEKTSLENTYPTWTLTRSKTRQPASRYAAVILIVVFALDGASAANCI